MNKAITHQEIFMPNLNVPVRTYPAPNDKPTPRSIPVPDNSAVGILRETTEVLEERGKTYDSPGGERSMAKTVAVFNLLTGHNLSEVDGWDFMTVLKQVRQHGATQLHRDSAVDGINYTALSAEAKGKLCNPKN